MSSSSSSESDSPTLDIGRQLINGGDVNTGGHRPNEEQHSWLANFFGSFKHFPKMFKIFDSNYMNSRDENTRHHIYMRFSHFLLFLLFLLCGIALFILVPIGEFDVKSKYTTDFLTDKQSPDGVNGKLFLVGEVKFGYFVASIFLFEALLYFFSMRNKYARDNESAIHKTNLDYGYDDMMLWIYISVGLLSVPICAVIGMTNIFVILLSSSLLIGIGVKFQHELPITSKYHTENIEELVKHFNTEVDKNTTTGDTKIAEPDRNDLTGHPIAYTTKFYTNILSFFGIDRKNVKSSSRRRKFHKAMLRAIYAGLYVHFSAILAWTLYFATVMAYYVSALHSDSATFEWWVHVGFWMYQALVFIMFFFPLLFWENTKHDYVSANRNALKSNQKSTFVHWLTFYRYNMIQHYVYAFFQVAVGFLILSGSNDNFGVLY